VPTMRVANTNIAALATVFPLQGQQYEYLKWPARVQFALVANAAGIVGTVYSGSDLLQQRAPLIVKATILTVYPDDFFLDDVADAGERLSVELSETANVATTDTETTAIITPLV
jgi:hypothetical protein